MNLSFVKKIVINNKTSLILTTDNKLQFCGDDQRGGREKYEPTDINRDFDKINDVAVYKDSWIVVEQWGTY